jgi:hypothetical protein
MPPTAAKQTANPDQASFLASMTFAAPAASKCAAMGCTHDHSKKPPQAVNNSLFCLPVANAPIAQSVVDTKRLTLTQLEQALEHAISSTKTRLLAIEKSLNTTTNTDKQNALAQRKARLESRLKDFKAIPVFLETNKLEFKGFSGWDKTNVNKEPRQKNVSQFDSVLVETQTGETQRLPLDSRIAQVKGDEVDLINQPVAHEDHFHDLWATKTLQSCLDSSIKWEMGQDDEGCPCCVAGLDFDEFAAAIKEITKSYASSNSWIGTAEVSSAEHWGIVLGTAAPFGLIGLAAAIRNIKGSRETLKNLNPIIAGLNEDIQRLKAGSFLADAIKLKAFKNCLEYSKFDAKFNLVIPGVVNGIASTLVLGTAFLSHPFALPAIALYATGQVARNSVDLVRAAPRAVKVETGDSIEVLEGKQKVNQIEQSKRRFYAANTAGFAMFAAGAVMTFLSIPAFGALGLGALMLPVGLGLLAGGAVSTGIMNNIWPKKFKPRNGNLGQARETFNQPNDVLVKISNLQGLKKDIQLAKASVAPAHKAKKFGLKILAALPEFKDFLPARIADRITQFNTKWLGFLPPLGNQATQRKHALNIETVKAIHENEATSSKVIQTRVSMLRRIAGTPIDSTRPLNEYSPKDLAKESWELLVKLKHQAEVVQTGIQNGFFTNQQGLGNIPGFEQNSDNWMKFNFKRFIENCSTEQLQAFNQSVDFYLFWKLPKTAKYQQYGLNDYYWSWKKQLDSI